MIKISAILARKLFLKTFFLGIIFICTHALLSQTSANAIKKSDRIDATFPKFMERQAPATNLKYGKYSCTASKYRNGSYEFIPRGSFTIYKNGKYSYAGFEKPSTGTFVVDKQGNLLFKGGYLNGGKAEKIDRPNKFFLVFPANPDNRWTCTLVN